MLFDKFKKDETTALWWNGYSLTYSWLSEEIKKLLENNVLPTACVVSLEGTFCPKWLVLFFALIEKKCILVPLNSGQSDLSNKLLSAQVEFRITISESIFFIEPTNIVANHALYKTIKNTLDSGLVLYTTGSTGKPRAAVHSFNNLLTRYKKIKKPGCTLCFLHSDHMGGLHTIIYTLLAGCALAIPNNRSPKEICKTIQESGVELLPTTPTFLKLLLFSNLINDFNLSSLKKITYGAEPMAPSDLKSISLLFPKVTFKQTYGQTELGVLATTSENSQSTWFKLFNTYRIKDGILELMVPSLMLGYINEEELSNNDWFSTGDLVEINGDWLRVVGRKSETINVGGVKIHPFEIEKVISEIFGVVNVTVLSEDNILLGKIVCAHVELLDTTETVFNFIKKMHTHCSGKLSKEFIPQRVVLINSINTTDSIKKIRQ